MIYRLKWNEIEARTNVPTVKPDNDASKIWVYVNRRSGMVICTKSLKQALRSQLLHK